MNRQSLEDHVAAIEACRQRGGRMLSIVDLVEAGTFSQAVAAYAIAAVGKGASFLTGARPGGAGKTTVMCALLNFVPPDVSLVAADSLETIERGLRGERGKSCFICHEIGPGLYYAYLWGEPLRRYFELPGCGHMLATNLHADTIEEAREQICGLNGVSTEKFRRVNLCFFLQWDWKTDRRRIVAVEESDGQGDHHRLWGVEEQEFRIAESRLVTRDEWMAAGRLLQRLMGSGARTVKEVRRWVLERRGEDGRE